jgi:hypothetical protein
MKTSVLKPFGVRTAAIIILIPASIHPATDSLIPSMEAYFSALKEEVNRDAATSIVKNTAGVQLYGYFTAVIKKNPSIRSLMKVDGRGRVVCERVRGKKYPPQRRSVSQCGWFAQTAKSLKEYQCAYKDENGRAALSWSVPLLRNGTGVQRFNGAFIAIIDLHHCFRAIAKAGAPPFLVRLDDKDFYAHSWKSEMIFNENRLVVPGVSAITVRYQNNNVSVLVQPESTRIVDPDTLRQSPIAVAQRDSPALFAAVIGNTGPATAKKNIPVIIGLLVLIAFVTVLLVIQIAGGITRRRTGASKEKRDLL